MNDYSEVFSPIQSRQPISKVVAHQIEEAIYARKFPPGSKLPSEQELCDIFSVSRTSVRSALTLLEANNLITISKGKGAYVEDINAEIVSKSLERYLKYKLDSGLVLDLVHARQILEPEVASLAAEHRTDEDIKLLSENIEEYENSEGDYDELAQLDVEFHRIIAQASKNKVIPSLIKPIHRLFPKIKKTIHEVISDTKSSALVKHKNIYYAVLEQDPDRARQAMIDHLAVAEEHARQLLERMELAKSGDSADSIIPMTKTKNNNSGE